MIDLNFHPLRKALQLSLNEMAVLKEVYELSNNTKFNGWCVKSRTKIADSLDLSRQCVITCLNTLQLKGYVDYNKELGMCRPTDMIRELAQERENIGIMIKTEGYEIMSVKLAEMVKSMTPNNDGKEGCKKKLHVSKDFTEVSKKLTVGVKKIDTYSISLSNSEKEYIQNEGKDTLQVDISFSVFWDIYSGMLNDESLNRKEQASNYWEKLSLEEKEQAIEYAKKVFENKTPKHFVVLPDKLLRLKIFKKEPHKHVEKEYKQEVIIDEQEKQKYYSRQSKDEIIELIKSGQEKKILSFTSYEFTCKKYNLEQRYTDSYIFYGYKI